MKAIIIDDKDCDALLDSLVDGGNRRAFNPEMNHFIDMNH